MRRDEVVGWIYHTFTSTQVKSKEYVDNDIVEVTTSNAHFYMDETLQTLVVTSTNSEVNAEYTTDFPLHRADYAAIEAVIKANRDAYDAGIGVNTYDE